MGSRVKLADFGLAVEFDGAKKEYFGEQSCVIVLLVKVVCLLAAPDQKV